MNIRLANEKSDADSIWEIVEYTIRTGDTWVFEPDSSREKILNYWLDKEKFTYVFEIKNRIIGIFFFKANQPDLGNHIANAGYIVHPDYRGQKIAEKMCLASIEEAKNRGFLGMQFNIVVATNKAAIHVWKKCGFSIIGTIPNAFRHQQLGLVDAHIMFLWFGDENR